MQCCNPEIDGGGGWGIFNSLFGWTNSATYGSVISYNLYWLAVILGFLAMGYNERRGHWPLMKKRAGVDGGITEHDSISSGSASQDKTADQNAMVREVSPSKSG